MKLKVTNPTIQSDYGEWELLDLVKALANPREYEDELKACIMKIDLAADQLEFKIIKK